MADSVSCIFELESHATLESALEALSRLGYAVRPVGRSRGTAHRYVYFDSGDGGLRRAGFHLRREEGTGLWQLFQGSALVSEQTSVRPGPPPGGDLARRARGLSKRNPFIPHVDVLVTEQRLSLRGISGAMVRASLRTLEFSSPHEEGTVSSRLLLEVNSTRHSSGADYLSALLRRHPLAAEHRGDLLVLGLETLGLPLPGSALPRQWVVEPGDAFGEMAAKVLLAQLFRLRANAGGALHDLDPEYVHDMRVAARTLRQALRLFRRLLPPPWAAQGAAELAWLGQELGAVRDQDVFLALLRRELSRTAPRDVEKVISESVERSRASARESLRGSLRSARYPALLAQIEALAASAREGVPSLAGEPARAAGARLIRKLLSRVTAQRERPASTFSAEELHEIRIHLRRLRYACELFRPVFGGAVGRLIPLVVTYQDCLGEHQDASVALGRLDALARDLESRGALSGDVSVALEGLADSERRALAAARAEFSELWEALPRLARRMKRGVGALPPRPVIGCAPPAIA